MSSCSERRGAGWTPTLKYNPDDGFTAMIWIPDVLLATILDGCGPWSRDQEQTAEAKMEEEHSQGGEVSMLARSH